jgi:tetratricopeptide (TPR) repeat protein
MSTPASAEPEAPSPDPTPRTAAPRAPAAVSRPRLLDFLASLPAIVAALAMALVLGAAWASRPTTEQYIAELNRRDQKKDNAGALICLRRIVEMNPGRDDYRFKMAQLLERTAANDHAAASDRAAAMARAAAIVRAIAPYDRKRSGYPGADLWVAKHLAADRANSEQNFAQIEFRLKRIRDSHAKPEHLQYVRTATGMLGELYVSVGNYKDARPLLEEAAGDDPAQLYLLAVISEYFKDHERAVRSNESACKYARAIIDAGTADSEVITTAFKVLVSASVNLEKYDEALEVLDRAYTETHDPSFLASKSSVYAIWSKNLASAPGDVGGKTSQRIALIEKGLKFDPRNKDLWVQISKFMQSAGEESKTARAVLSEMLVSGKSPELVHLVLGNDAWERNDFRRARFHWEEAYKVEPKLPIVGNNLAYALAFHEPVDLPRAASIVEESLKATTEPTTTAQLLGTRGQIRVKLEKWSEGVSDLEKSLKAGQDTPGIHNSLAEAYDHLGLKDIADGHRKAANRPLASSPPAPPQGQPSH